MGRIHQNPNDSSFLCAPLTVKFRDRRRRRRKMRDLHQIADDLPEQGSLGDNTGDLSGFQYLLRIKMEIYGGDTCCAPHPTVSTITNPSYPLHQTYVSTTPPPHFKGALITLPLASLCHSCYSHLTAWPTSQQSHTTLALAGALPVSLSWSSGRGFSSVTACFGSRNQDPGTSVKSCSSNSQRQSCHTFSEQQWSK